MGILYSIGKLLNMFLDIYTWILMARILLSWVNPDPYNPIVRFLYQATEPVLKPARRLLPPLGGMDFSPMLVLFGVWLLQRVIATLFAPFLPGLGAISALTAELLGLVHLVVTLYLILLLIRAGLNFYSWLALRQRRRFAINLGNPAIRFIFQVTEPMLRPLRRHLSPVAGMDIAPIVGAVIVILGLMVMQELVAILTFAPLRSSW